MNRRLSLGPGIPFLAGPYNRNRHFQYRGIPDLLVSYSKNHRHILALFLLCYRDRKNSDFDPALHQASIPSDMLNTFFPDNLVHFHTFPGNDHGDGVLTSHLSPHFFYLVFTL
jgi:hypothetical protein